MRLHRAPGGGANRTPSPVRAMMNLHVHRLARGYAISREPAGAWIRMATATPRIQARCRGAGTRRIHLSKVRNCLPRGQISSTVGDRIRRIDKRSPVLNVMCRPFQHGIMPVVRTTRQSANVMSACHPIATFLRSTVSESSRRSFLPYELCGKTDPSWHSRIDSRHTNRSLS